MARRTTRSTTRRTTPAAKRPRARARRKKPFVLRWYHLIAASIGAFTLGYLIAFGQATTYVASVVGLR